MSSLRPAPSEVEGRSVGETAAPDGAPSRSADAVFTVRRVNAKVRPSGVARVRSGKAIDYSRPHGCMPCSDGRLSRHRCNAAKAEARLGAVEFGSRGGGACSAPARGVARITSSKIHARSGGGNRGVADVLVVQHQSTYKVEAFRNRNGDRAAGTIRARTSNG